MAKQVTKSPRPKLQASHVMCGGCGELFIPARTLQRVCSEKCEPIRQIEEKKAKEHAEKAAKGIWD